MIVREGGLGRIFVLRLEDGDRLPDCLEQLAMDKLIRGAACLMLGGLGGGKLVVGPEDGDAERIQPMLRELVGAHEVAAVGTLFPDSSGQPKLHMHATVGRGDASLTGCVRPGVDVWKIAEVVVIEITDTGLARKIDPSLGLEVLSIE